MISLSKPVYLSSAAKYPPQFESTRIHVSGDFAETLKRLEFGTRVPVRKPVPKIRTLFGESGSVLGFIIL